MMSYYITSLFAARYADGVSLQAHDSNRITLSFMKTVMERRWLWMAAIALASLLAWTGCQSSSTRQPASASSGGVSGAKAAGSPAGLAPKARPVVVHDFAFDAAQVKSDAGLLPGLQGPAQTILRPLRSEEPPMEKAARLARLLSETIAEELTARKIPTARQPRGMPLPDDGLVVDGEFLQVDEGNRLRRAMVGFGAGASEVLAQVSVFDLAQSRDQPILVYGTGKGSRPMPGALVTWNPYVMAAKYVLSHNATDKDVRRLGKQIAEDLCRIEAGGVLHKP